MNLVESTSGQQLRVVDKHGGGNGYAGPGRTVIAPTPISSYSTMSITAFRRAITVLADNLAGFPRAVYRDGVRPAEGEKPHALEPLLRRRPNAYQNPHVLWRTWFAHAASEGNAYLHVERDPRTLAPVGLHNLAPHDVCPVRFLREGAAAPEQYYVVRSTRQVLRGEDVLHLQALGYDGMKGASPVELHEATFQHAATLGKFQTRYLQTGTVINASIEVPGGMADAQVDEFLKLLRTHFYGSDADRDVLLLTHGAKLNNATVSPQESQLLQQGAVITKQIAQMTGVPPAFLFEFTEEKYRSTVEQDGQNLIRFTFRPWIMQAEAELSMKLLTEADQDAGYGVRLNPDALLRGSTKEQMDVVATGVKAGIYTANEGRGYLGKPPSDDPEAEKLKALGDTAPPKALAPADAGA